MADEAPKRARRASPPTARRRQLALRKQLRAMFEEVVDEPVPPELQELLDQLDERNKTKH